MPTQLQFIPEVTPEGLPSVIILLDRLRGGGTEAHSLWLSDALRAQGISAALCVLLPPASPHRSGRAEGARGLIASFWQFLKICQNSPLKMPRAVLCMGRVANCLGFIIKRRFPKVSLLATCRTSRALPLFYRHTLRRADVCLCNSRWAASQMAELGVRSSQISVIGNALLRPELLALDRTVAAQNAARAALGIDSNVPVLCMVAAFVKGKNQAALLRAVRGLNQPRQPYLLFAGEGPERHACQALSRELGMAERTLFLGRVDDLASVFEATDICVSTSLRDSLPNALIEAQAAALPVVAYNAAGVSEAFIPDRSGYAVPPGVESVLCAAINKLLQDADKARVFGQAGRSWIHETYAPEAIATAYRDCLEAVCPRIHKVASLP